MIGALPERLVEEILLLKVLKSVLLKYPLLLCDACVMLSVEPLNCSGAETVVACTTPEALSERSVEASDWKVAVPETLSAVVVAVSK